jgi:hypothetical protein
MSRWLKPILIVALVALAGTAARAERTSLGGTPLVGATADELSCPAGAYLVGLQVHYDNAVSGLQPYCAEMAEDGAWQTSSQLHGDRRMGGPRPNAKVLSLMCPEEFFVSGFGGGSFHNNDFRLLAQVLLDCRRLLGTGAALDVRTTLPSGAPVTPWDGDTCADDTVANGIFGTTYRGKVIQFGLSCKPTRPALAALPDVVGIDALDAPVMQQGGLKMQSDASDAIVAPPSPFGPPPAGAGSPTPAPAPAPGPKPLPPSQEFAPPLAKSGLRLYACQTVGGNACGGIVANAFCQQQGFVQAQGLDTDSRKVQAETLAGEKCAKKKCKVFERIICVR